VISEASTSFCTEPTTAREIPYQQTLQFVARTLQERRGTLLDVGCGNGAIAARLQSRGFRVTAIDVSTKAVAAARFQLETDGAKQGSLDAVGLRLWSTLPGGG